jgi:transcriptional regulator with XRE-family HTH domain
MSRSADTKLLTTYGTAQWAFRKAGALTQEKLLDQASGLGLEAPNRATISSLENGRKEPGLEMIFKLARALCVRPSVILREVEERTLALAERQRMDRSSVAKIETARLLYETKRRPKAPRAKRST